MNRTSASKLLSNILKPLIDCEKVVFRVCKYGNVDKKIKKIEEIDRR